MSRRRFLGWEPATVTTYEYDEAGRVVRSVTQTEPEWDEVEQAWAMALLEEEADACRGCGQPLSETTRPEAAGGYEALLPVVCHGCRALHHRQKDYGEVEDPGSYRFSVTRTWEEATDPHGR